jgi:hypothetical protein
VRCGGAEQVGCAGSGAPLLDHLAVSDGDLALVEGLQLLHSELAAQHRGVRLQVHVSATLDRLHPLQRHVLLIAQPQPDQVQDHDERLPSGGSKTLLAAAGL